MIRNSEFVIRQIQNSIYLLPMGQAVADFKHSLSLNEVGVFLWNQLSEEKNENDLLLAMYAQYEPEEHEKIILRNDLHQFINTLKENGALYTDAWKDEIYPGSEYFSIGGLQVLLHAPLEILHSNLLSFRVNENKEMTDCEISVIFHKPSSSENGQVILRNSQMLILENNQSYIFLFPAYRKIYELRLEKSSRKSYIFCNNEVDALLIEELFQTLRVAFLHHAISHGLLMLHSASICYKDKAWLFSGPSGTGKSTHTRLWIDFLNVSPINGDLNLIGIENNIPMVYGTPWCGTSGIYDTNTYPLGGIILLKQNQDDYCELLSPEQKTLQTLFRCISPTYQEQFIDKHLVILNQIVNQILICRLNCTPKKTALEISKAAIDQYLETLSF